MTSITSADCLFLRYITCTVFWLIMWQVLHFIRIDCLKMVDFPLLHWTPYISTMPIFTLLFCQIFDFFNQSQHASVIFITYTTLLLKNNILTSVRFFFISKSCGKSIFIDYTTLPLKRGSTSHNESDIPAEELAATWGVSHFHYHLPQDQITDKTEVIYHIPQKVNQRM
jgi:hypothetical protein